MLLHLNRELHRSYLVNLLNFHLVEGGGPSPQLSTIEVASGFHDTKNTEFHLNMRKYFLTAKMTQHWHKLPREAVESLH